MASDARIFAHWKSLKWADPVVNPEYKDSRCMLGGCSECSGSPATPNHIWLLLARVHKMRVREIKDAVNRVREQRRAA